MLCLYTFRQVWRLQSAHSELNPWKLRLRVLVGRGCGVATRGGMQALGEPSLDGVARWLYVAVADGNQRGQHHMAQEDSVWL